MNEAQLIKKIKRLKAIKPRRDWVLLSKRQILGEGRRVEIFPFLRPVYAGLFCLLFLVGLFEFSQDSLPGESLYYLKKITEKSQIIFSSEKEKPKVRLEQVNNILEDIIQIVQENEMRKLGSALIEYQEIASEAVNNKSVEAMTSTSDWMVVKEIIKNEKQLQTEYGVVLGEVSKKGSGFITISEDVKQDVEWLIRDIEETTLSEEDEALFKEAKEYYMNQDYSSALEKILVEMNK